MVRSIFFSFYDSIEWRRSGFVDVWSIYLGSNNICNIRAIINRAIISAIATCILLPPGNYVLETKIGSFRKLDAQNVGFSQLLLDFLSFSAIFALFWLWNKKISRFSMTLGIIDSSFPRKKLKSFSTQKKSRVKLTQPIKRRNFQWRSSLLMPL